MDWWVNHYIRIESQSRSSKNTCLAFSLALQQLLLLHSLSCCSGPCSCSSHSPHNPPCFPTNSCCRRPSLWSQGLGSETSGPDSTLVSCSSSASVSAVWRRRDLYRQAENRSLWVGNRLLFLMSLAGPGRYATMKTRSRQFGRSTRPNREGEKPVRTPCRRNRWPGWVDHLNSRRLQSLESDNWQFWFWKPGETHRPISRWSPSVSLEEASVNMFDPQGLKPRVSASMFLASGSMSCFLWCSNLTKVAVFEELVDTSSFLLRLSNSVVHLIMMMTMIQMTAMTVTISSIQRWSWDRVASAGWGTDRPWHRRQF